MSQYICESATECFHYIPKSFEDRWNSLHRWRQSQPNYESLSIITPKCDDNRPVVRRSSDKLLVVQEIETKGETLAEFMARKATCSHISENRRNENVKNVD